MGQIRYWKVVGIVTVLSAGGAYGQIAALAGDAEINSTATTAKYSTARRRP
jgi:hypothetical protein